MKLNVADLICGHVEQHVPLPNGTIYIDFIPDDGEGVCIRHDPAPAAERRYCDGTRLLQWNFTFYARMQDAAVAREYLKAFTDELDGTTIADPKTGTEIDCEAATLPQFIGIDEKELTTYAAAITARYLEEQ